MSDFQPHPVMDRSSRIHNLHSPGWKQLEPIYAFASLDAYARGLCYGPCLSDPCAVSDPERLLKFGRAGWYSLYMGRDESDAPFFNLNTLCRMAGHKLLDLSTDSDSERQLEKLMKDAGSTMPPCLSLKLLALLAVRLDIVAGASTVEAGKLVASHLAVLTAADAEQPFLKVRYPSEPILAHVSASHLQRVRWDRPLLALCNFIDSSVVDAGFRGELLTKIICLLSMDEILNALPDESISAQAPSQSGASNRTHDPPPSSSPNQPSGIPSLCIPPSDTISPYEPVPKNHWRFATPIKVSHFLDQLIVAPPGHRSFSMALISKSDDLNLDTP